MPEIQTYTPEFVLAAKAAGPLLAEEIDTLCRINAQSLSAYLSAPLAVYSVPSALTEIHTQVILRMHSGEVRVADLAKWLRHQVVSYAIPRSLTKSAVEHAQRSGGDVSAISKLNDEAKSLFADVKKSGEGGEALLFVLAEALFRYPQVLCKMSLKTNSKNHYHGSDGIHISVKKDGVLNLHWCESKLYKNPESAINECLDSIKEFLVYEGGSNARQERDLQLIRLHADLANPEAETALKRYLDPEDPNHLKVNFCGICFAGFDLNAYPDFRDPEKIKQVTDALASTVDAWHATASKRVKLRGLTEKTIQMVFLPFPTVEGFRQSFLKELGF